MIEFWAVVIEALLDAKERRPFIFAMVLFFIGLAIFFGINEWMTAEGGAG